MGGGAGMPIGGLEGHRGRMAAGEGPGLGLAARRHGRRRGGVPSVRSFF